MTYVCMCVSVCVCIHLDLCVVDGEDRWFQGCDQVCTNTE